MVSKIHSTEEKEIDLNRKYYKSGHPNGKPHGLWYDINGEWKHWCEDEEFEGIYKNNFELEIDTTQILIIENYSELLSFHNKYSVPGKHSYGIFTARYNSIDWQAVRSRYKGIEIRNFNRIKYTESNGDYPMWFYGWDVSSGCIWDLSCITKVKKL
jgi:hypothetical protein